MYVFTIETYTYFHTSASNIFVQRKFYAQVLLTSECKTRFYDNIHAHALIYWMILYRIYAIIEIGLRY